jgi:putative transposase
VVLSLALGDHVVSWMVAHRENATLAERPIRETCVRQGIGRKHLTVALLLADLGVTKTHGRPHVSNDNLFSEAQFKTLKSRPDSPERIGSIQDAPRVLPGGLSPGTTASTGTAASAC